MEWNELYEKWGGKPRKIEKGVTMVEEPRGIQATTTEEPKKIQDITIRVEKLEAKFEFFDNLRKTLEEKISHISEQIGELRSMLIGREKFYGDVEVSCRKMEAIMEMIKSENVIKQLKRREKDVLENRARVERIENLVEKFGEEMKQLRGVLERVKPLENILGISKEIDGKIKIIEEKKNYIDRTVGKVEKIYADMDKFVSDIETLKSDLETVKNGIKETVRLIDEVKLSQENFITKTEMGEFKNSLKMMSKKEHEV